MHDRKFLDLVVDEVVADVLAMSDEEVLQEAIDALGSEEAAVAEAQRIRDRWAYWVLPRTS